MQRFPFDWYDEVYKIQKYKVLSRQNRMNSNFDCEKEEFSDESSILDSVDIELNSTLKCCVYTVHLYSVISNRLRSS